jgi:hypothetical protein
MTHTCTISTVLLHLLLLLMPQMFDGLKKELENSARLRAALMRERDEMRKRADASDSKLAVALQEQQTLATKVRLSWQSGCAGCACTMWHIK